MEKHLLTCPASAYRLLGTLSVNAVLMCVFISHSFHASADSVRKLENVDFHFRSPVKGLHVSFDIDQNKISGTVESGTGESMPGVNILEKGTTNGTTTDVDGRFSISVSEGDAILVFSFIGFVTQEVAVNGRSVIDVVLTEDVQNLEEVVVVGYGTQKKSDLTGSVARANIDAFRESPNVNIAQSRRDRSGIEYWPGKFRRAKSFNFDRGSYNHQWKQERLVGSGWHHLYRTTKRFES
jgi:hypothetical protein